MSNKIIDVEAKVVEKNNEAQVTEETKKDSKIKKLGDRIGNVTVKDVAKKMAKGAIGLGLFVGGAATGVFLMKKGSNGDSTEEVQNETTTE